ncbi:MAG: RHS repeat-associated core domain-containing protein, partial [Acidobacteria bacterium]|nr:RHS repeat-associated core domain-containing protein [Acidobacteriota bacterium]
QKYTGYERDGETGLDYAGARYFDSKPGRFTSTDPTPVTQENFVNPQRWNLYIYVNNNPLSSSDPDGADGQGQGGDKIISVFLAIQVNDRNRVHRTVNGVSTEELEAGPLWQDTKKHIETLGQYKLNLYGAADVTGNTGIPMLASAVNFENALKSSEAVIFVGHGNGPAGIRPFEPIGITVGGAQYQSNGVFQAGIGRSKPLVNAEVICNFSCNSAMRSDYFNFRSTTSITVTINSGPEGLTNLGTLEKAAEAFARAYAQAQGTIKDKVEAGRRAAQAVIDKSLDREIDRGDRITVNE